MKKLISVLLCVLILLFSLSAASFAAVSEGAGMSAIRAQWTRDKGPKTEGYAVDYSIFSPVANGASAENKYPLVVILPGLGESSYEGEELVANDFPLWSSAEYQQKFYNGGAYIIIARSQEGLGINWDSALIIPALKAAIDDACRKNPNIDTDRIYVLGWSLGSTGAKRLTVNYENFVAAAVIFSPVAAMSADDAAACRNKAVWTIGCKNDSISVYSLYTKPSWNRLVENTSDYSKVRLTTTETAPNVSALLNHNTWDLAVRDMTDNGGCTGVTTIDGSGRTIYSPSIIEWLNQQSLIIDEPDNSCSHICHKSGISGFFYKIARLFWMLFGIEQTCSCGVEHY